METEDSVLKGDSRRVKSKSMKIGKTRINFVFGSHCNRFRNLLVFLWSRRIYCKGSFSYSISGNWLLAW